jgi:predicted regulator of Ras-like GTPase activity (Roadblock/LC7/MglB family)
MIAPVVTQVSRPAPPGDPQQELDRVLQAIALEIPGTRVVVVGDGNGLPVASFSKGTKSMAATAVATLIVTASQDLTKLLELRDFRDVLVEGRNWKVFVRLLQGNFTFMAVLEGEANLGLMRLEMNRRCREIEGILGAFR